MALTIAEANAINKLLRYFLDPAAPTEDPAREAAQLLAEKARRALMTGVTPEKVAELWQQRLDAQGARCSCNGDPIECSHEAARGQAEAERDRARQTWASETRRADLLEAELKKVRAKLAAPLQVKATGFGKTVITATGETTLNIKAADRSIHIDLGTEFAEPMAVLLLDDPEDSDGTLDEPEGRPGAYVNGDDGYKWLTCTSCDGPIHCIDAGDDLAGLVAKSRAHTCAPPTAEPPVEKRHGMWPGSLTDPVVLAAAKVLTDAGFQPAQFHGDSGPLRQGATGWYVPLRDSSRTISVYDVRDGAFTTRTRPYEDAFRAAGWTIEPVPLSWNDIRVTPPASPAPASGSA